MPSRSSLLVVLVGFAEGSASLMKMTMTLAIPVVASGWASMATRRACPVMPRLVPCAGRTASLAVAVPLVRKFRRVPFP